MSAMMSTAKPLQQYGKKNKVMQVDSVLHFYLYEALGNTKAEPLLRPSFFHFLTKPVNSLTSINEIK